MTALWVILLVISIIILLYTLIMMAQPSWNRPKIFWGRNTGCLTGVIAFVILIFAVIMLVRGCS